MGREALAAFIAAVENSGGSGACLRLFAPTRADDELFVAWLGRFERVTVGPTDVLVAFWPVYRKRLTVAELVSVRDVPRLTPSMVGGGTGLRFASGHRVALLFGAGAATEIETTSGRTYLVVVRDSEALTAAVERLIPRP